MWKGKEPPFCTQILLQVIPLQSLQPQTTNLIWMVGLILIWWFTNSEERKSLLSLGGQYCLSSESGVLTTVRLTVTCQNYVLWHQQKWKVIKLTVFKWSLKTQTPKVLSFLSFQQQQEKEILQCVKKLWSKLCKWKHMAGLSSLMQGAHMEGTAWSSLECTGHWNTVSSKDTAALKEKNEHRAREGWGQNNVKMATSSHQKQLWDEQS